MISLLDTGFLYALIDSTDEHHVPVLSAMRSYRGSILFPIPAITEVTFLLVNNLGIASVARFLESLKSSPFEMVAPEMSDYSCSAEILSKYHDNNLDFVDALIFAMAERLNITSILTVDRRHFSVCNAFDLLPEA